MLCGSNFSKVIPDVFPSCNYGNSHLCAPDQGTVIWSAFIEVVTLAEDTNLISGRWLANVAFCTLELKFK